MIKTNQNNLIPGTKRRLFVDMDGTLCQWKDCEKYEDLYEPGFFSSMLPNTALVDAIKIIFLQNEIVIYILSAALADSDCAVKEKNMWLDLHLPEVDHDHRIFVSTDIKKYAAVPGGIRPTDILLDDYSKNLHEWSEKAVAVKFLNGVNGTNGTWERCGGFVVHGNKAADKIAQEVTNICVLHNNE